MWMNGVASAYAAGPSVASEQGKQNSRTCSLLVEHICAVFPICNNVKPLCSQDPLLQPIMDLMAERWSPDTAPGGSDDEGGGDEPYGDDDDDDGDCAGAAALDPYEGVEVVQEDLQHEAAEAAEEPEPVATAPDQKIEPNPAATAPDPDPAAIAPECNHAATALGPETEPNREATALDPIEHPPALVEPCSVVEPSTERAPEQPTNAKPSFTKLSAADLDMKRARIQQLKSHDHTK